MNSTALCRTDVAADFASDVRAGLLRPGQKELPSKYLYDAIGSKLFEVITELPEYGATRADERILRTHAEDIVEHMPGDVILAELGSGSGRKTRWVLEALARRRRTQYYPIEISAAALEFCRRELSDIPCSQISGIESEYLEGLRKVTALRRAGQSLLILFLGSTVGNFVPPTDLEFLRSVRSLLEPGDAILLGTDMEKPAEQLIPAYDDSIGVTAAFNLNLLARMNRELGANFVLANFRHLAKFNAQTNSIEMHLLSTCVQTVTIPQGDCEIHFRAGETIWTENSRKYFAWEPEHLANAAGFRCTAQWSDRQWPFAESLLSVE